MRFLFVISFALITLGTIAQSKTVGGSITDTAGAPLADVYVKLTSPADTLTAVTNASGKFRFAVVNSPSFLLTATSIGFQTISQEYTVANNGKAFMIDPIKLQVQLNQLAGVV